MKLFKKLCINFKPTFGFGPKTHWIDNDVKLKNPWPGKNFNQNKSMQEASTQDSKQELGTHKAIIIIILTL